MFKLLLRPVTTGLVSSMLLFSVATAVQADAGPTAATELPSAQRPAGWHARDRIFATAPVDRTIEQIRTMRSGHRPDPPTDPTLACYYREHIVNRCPQNALRP